MAQGPGRYDHLCTAAREAVQAEFAILIIANGNRGSGFSYQALSRNPKDVVPNLEKMLQVLDVTIVQIKKDLEEMKRRQHSS